MFLNGGESVNFKIDTEFFDETIVYEGSVESSYLAKKYLIGEEDNIYGQLFTTEKEAFIINLNTHIAKIEEELTNINNEGFVASEKENNMKMVDYYIE